MELIVFDKTALDEEGPPSLGAQGRPQWFCVARKW